MFKVLDAHRVSKRGMEELMPAEKLNEYIETYAVYRMDIWKISTAPYLKH